MYAAKTFFVLALTVGSALSAFAEDSLDGLDPYYDQEGNPKSPESLERNVQAQTRVIQHPDGTLIPLQEQEPPIPADGRKQLPEALIRPQWSWWLPLPQSVDLTPYQSPVQNQGGRNTCGTFATVAALEAAYRRTHGVTLDLSEQYLNHWAQQFATAKGKPLPGNETVAGSIGGGGSLRPLEAMKIGLAVPPETALRYIPNGGYEQVDPYDRPSLNDWTRTYTQRAMDDFNLADQPANYIYENTTIVNTTVMPQQALDQARYRATGVTYFSDADLRNLDSYRTALADQRELIVEMRCCDGNPGFGSNAPWRLPSGSSGGPLAHVVLIVGYNNSTRMFRIKNSWSTAWAEGGYAWISYDFILAAAYRVAYLNGIVSPQVALDPWNFKHFILGRWQLNFDGWKGVLDIYNLPQDWYVSNTGANYRIGTLFMNDGRIHRVNGTLQGNALTFWVDWNKANAATSSLTGSAFTVRIFSWDHRSMAGTLRDPNGGTYAVEMVKGTAPITGAAMPGPLSPVSYIGTWDLNHDGWRGRLEIIFADPLTRVLGGRYVEANGTVRSVSGTVNPDARLFRLTIGFPTPQVFDGFLNGHELGVMAGNTVWNGMTFGFYGSRRP